MHSAICQRMQGRVNDQAAAFKWTLCTGGTQQAQHMACLAAVLRWGMR